jgi:hypothetical protein
MALVLLDIFEEAPATDSAAALSALVKIHLNMRADA